MGYRDMHESWRQLCDWISRMSVKHGGTVYDLETGKDLDWGQALCREVYGVDWMNNPDKKAADESDTCPPEVLDAATSWENGKWPKWARAEG